MQLSYGNRTRAATTAAEQMRSEVAAKTADNVRGAKLVMSLGREAEQKTLFDRSVEILFDWSGAAVMSVLLLVATLVLYAIYYRVTDVRRMMGA